MKELNTFTECMRINDILFFFFLKIFQKLDTDIVRELT